VNRLSLTGQLTERSALRYTPAGLPALDLLLQHESVVEEDGQWRRVQMDLKAVVIGTLAPTAQQWPLSEPRVFHGFLTASRNGRGHVFHLTASEPHID